MTLLTLTDWNMLSCTSHYRLVAISSDRDWSLYKSYNSRKVLLVYKHKTCKTERFFVGNLDEFNISANTYTHIKTKLDLQVVYDTRGTYNLMLNTSGYEPIPTSLDEIQIHDVFMSVLCHSETISIVPDDKNLIPIIPVTLFAPTDDD